MGNANHVPISILIDSYNDLCAATDDNTQIDPTIYTMIIGSFIFAIVYARPDIAFALWELSQFMQELAEHYGRALERVIGYLQSTIKLWLRFGPVGDSWLVVYLDADYATSKMDRKSISGTVGTL